MTASWDMFVYIISAFMVVVPTTIVAHLSPAVTISAPIPVWTILVVPTLPAPFQIIVLFAAVWMVWYRIPHRKSAAYAVHHSIVMRIVTVKMVWLVLSLPADRCALIMPVVFRMNAAKVESAGRFVDVTTIAAVAKFVWD